MADIKQVVTVPQIKTLLAAIKPKFAMSVNGNKPDASGKITIPTFTGATSTSGGTNGLVPAPATGKQSTVLKGDGTWGDLSVMTGATTSADGKEGLVPTPSAGSSNRYLSANGQWQEVDATRLAIVGTVLAYAGNTVPDGYLQCNGAAVSRTTYAALYAAIGTTYGSGNGSTTFNLPNLTDKFIEGSDTAGTAIDAGLPNITGTINKAMLLPTTTFDGAFSGTVTSGYGYYDLAKNNWAITFNASNSNAIYGNSLTVQPAAITMRYIIKY